LFENVAYLGLTVINQNFIDEEIKRRLNSRTYETKILPVVLHRYETWSLILREEYRLRVCQNRVLRRICGPRRDEVTGGWRKLHNKELHNLYSSPSIVRIKVSRKMRWELHVTQLATKRNACRFLVGKPEGK
jgi:hypothetical protein